MTDKVLILLVEDDDLIRDLLEEAMTEAGFALVIATNGTTALTELGADAMRFRAVVSDIKLGDGPNGWAVVRHARELAPEMPVVYMSGDSGAEWASNGVPHSVMVPKPFVAAQIITAVAALLNTAGPS